jgi:hypothetical protein
MSTATAVFIPAAVAWWTLVGLLVRDAITNSTAQFHGMGGTQ